MTRRQFLEEVNDFSDLLNFCYENGCEEYVEDIIGGDVIAEQLDEEIPEFLRQYSWVELRDKLSDIPTGYDFYRSSGGWLEYEGLEDGDFEYYKDSVLSYYDSNGYWDEEDEEDEIDEQENDDYPIPEEEFSVQVLIQICGRRADDYTEETRKKMEEDSAEQRAEEDAFNGFLTSIAAKNKLPDKTASWD